VAACAAACSALPIVTFSTTAWDAAKTATIAGEWTGVYNPTTPGEVAAISDKMFGAGTAKTHCLGFEHKAAGSCLLWATAIPEVNDSAGDDETCYIRKYAEEYRDDILGKWKAYMDYLVGDYKTTQDAYVNKLAASGGWADYEVKGGKERTRLANKAGYVQRQAKITAATADYVAGTFTIVLRTKGAAADSDVLKSVAWLKTYATLHTTALYQQLGGAGGCVAAGGAALSTAGKESGSEITQLKCEEACEEEGCTFYTHDSLGPK